MPIKTGAAVSPGWETVHSSTDEALTASDGFPPLAQSLVAYRRGEPTRKRELSQARHQAGAWRT